MNRGTVLLVAAGAVSCAFGAAAHHSFATAYDESETVLIEGTVVQFTFRNPHAWIHVTAPDEHGELQRWAVEWGGAGSLAAQGVTRDSLQPGDHVLITGNPGRNPPDYRLRLLSLRRPLDDFGWGFDGESFD